MIKLIVSDIDGTLAEDGASALNPELYREILRLKEKGIYFAGASGRHAASMEYVFKPVCDKIFYIADNGAYVGCYGRNLFLTEYKKTLAKSMIADMKEAGLDLLVDCADCVYVDSKNPEFIDWMKNGYHFRMAELADLQELDKPIVKIAGCRMSGIQDHETAPFIKKYGKELKVTLSGSQWLDTMDPGVNKGNAVRLLQESLGILPKETMAFGDQLNDVEMLQQAYYGFAVANARLEVKEAARFLADSNVNDGVLKILKLL
ncbi:MAG: HAD family hydrolase [Lachnospiraceae bacterium]|jgi:Cof subfamily protein (haloacid dehalogenase superfamily)|nr:HAD family hydrolase [Lachnospiraceae bacterium]